MFTPSQQADLNRALTADLNATRWWVALSGGLDSTVLLNLLHNWCRDHSAAPQLQAIHVNHGMQAEADAWELHCQQLCAQLGVQLTCVRVAVEPDGRGAEAAARDARYRAFEQHLEVGELLFMGHHLDDQVETVMLRLFRGAGVQGLAGIPAARSLGKGELRRPLLRLPRQTLAQYAAQGALSWLDDPSNADTSLDRNFLRQQILPLVASRWPGYRRTVGRAAAHLATAAETLEQQSLLPTVYNSLGDPGVALAELLAGGTPEEVMARLRGWLRGRALPMPAESSLREFTRQLLAGAASGKARLQWGEQTLQCYRESVYRLPGPQLFVPPAPLSLAPGQCLTVPGVGELCLVPASAGGIELASEESLMITWRAGGERCQPVARGAGRSLKKLLQDAAVPPWWRSRVPLFRLHGELLAVGDLWLCQSSRYRSSGDNCWEPCWRRKTGPD